MSGILMILCAVVIGVIAEYCTMPKDDTLYIYPSPKNCSIFIACINHETYEFSCFDAPLFLKPLVCVDACPKEETGIRRPARKSRNIPIMDLKLHPEKSARTVVCPQNGITTARIISSCSEYISCNNGMGMKVKCPAGQYYNAEKSNCAPKSESNCIVFTQKGRHVEQCFFHFKDTPLYLPSSRCDRFLRCSDGVAYMEACAKNTVWTRNHVCEWRNQTECFIDERIVNSDVDTPDDLFCNDTRFQDY